MIRIKQILSELGVLRLLLTLLVLLVVVLRPLAEGEVSYNGWRMITTLIVPAVVPLVLAGVLLDILMSSVFMVDKTGVERKRFKMIIVVHLGSVALLLIAWVSYFASIGE